MSDTDLELYEAKKVQIQRSPTITVAYNRKHAEQIGTLSPEVIRILNDKHHYKID